MSLGLVPTQFPTGFLRQVFSGRRSNCDVCWWLLSSRYVLLSRAVTTISVKAMVLYTLCLVSSLLYVGARPKHVFSGRRSNRDVC